MNVRFGSKADICAAKCHVRFTTESDMCGALASRKAPTCTCAEQRPGIVPEQLEALDTFLHLSAVSSPS